MSNEIPASCKDPFVYDYPSFYSTFSDQSSSFLDNVESYDNFLQLLAVNTIAKAIKESSEELREPLDPDSMWSVATYEDIIVNRIGKSFKEGRIRRIEAHRYSDLLMERDSPEIMEKMLYIFYEMYPVSGPNPIFKKFDAKEIRDTSYIVTMERLRMVIPKAEEAEYEECFYNLHRAIKLLAKKTEMQGYMLDN